MQNKSLFQLVEEFLTYKRGNGCIYAQGEYHLKKYLAFSEYTNPDEVIPSKEIIDAFMSKYINVPGSLYNAVSVIREFGRYLFDRGYSEVYVIPKKKVGLPTPVQPYFFTATEISSFFEECDNITDIPHLRGRHLVLPAMYRIMYCCGLRCTEARTLRCENVHLEKRYIDIIQSKGPKSRRIFISDELQEYLNNYNQMISILFPDRKIFFPNKKDQPYESNMLDKNFHKLWYRAFPETKGSGISIRPYDFRHHFAYANMNRWLREGKDVNAILPYLMRYMGHSDIESTLYYFHLVPDIYDAIVKKSLPFGVLIPEVD